MSNLLSISNLSKSYGNHKVLDEVSLELETGKILGLLGPNGSGKTTLLKIAAGILQPSSGNIQINGLPPGIETKAIVSYLPDSNNLYHWMAIEDALRFYDSFFQDFDIKKALDLLKQMELKKSDKITDLSKGMVEKLRLVLALSRNAQLYLLDEPLEGIDPAARVKITNTILDSFNPNCSFIISTHIISDIEKIFEDVALINRGKIVKADSIETIRNDYGKSLEKYIKEVFKYD